MHKTNIYSILRKFEIKNDNEKFNKIADLFYLKYNYLEANQIFFF